MVLAWNMHVRRIVVVWCDNAIGRALIPKISRDSGENFYIVVFFLSIFRRKITEELCFMKRIGVIFAMAYEHKSCSCNLVRQGHRVCDHSENFARFGWKFRYLWFLYIFRGKIDDRSFYQADRGSFGMQHARKSCTCNLMRQGKKVCVRSENFAWFGWNFRYLLFFYHLFDGN